MIFLKMQPMRRSYQTIKVIPHVTLSKAKGKGFDLGARDSSLRSE